MNIKINEAIVHDICLKLVEHDGSMIKVYNEMKTGIVSYNIIKQIKYKNSWTDISDKYFNKDSFKKRSTHYISNKTVELICELLVKHDGSVVKVMKEIVHINPNITIGNVSNIKYKTAWVEISDKYFDENLFNTQREENIKLICETLIKYNGSTKKTFNELRLKLSDFSLKEIENIKYKRVCRKISDKYFSADTFKKKAELPELTEEAVRAICEAIVKHKGSPFKAFKELDAGNLDNITIKRVRTIRYKEAWRKISDEYFKSEDFKK